MPDLNPVQDYTDPDEIIRGSRWPPAGIYKGVRITHPTAWPAGSAAWTWTLRLTQTELGGVPDLTITASSATIVGGDVMELTFRATSVQTATLPGDGNVVFYVDVKSDDGAGGVDYYDCVQGTANVRDASGRV